SGCSRTEDGRTLAGSRISSVASRCCRRTAHGCSACGTPRSATAAIAAFVRLQQDRYADMESHLVDCYGTLTPERNADVRFRTIDYPSFDLGAVKLGLGLFAEHLRYQHASIWCWSRVVNWHK